MVPKPGRCVLHVLQEDPFNAIMAGAATGGFLQLRAGLKPAFRSAMVGGVLLVSQQHPLQLHYMYTLLCSQTAQQLVVVLVPCTE